LLQLASGDLHADEMRSIWIGQAICRISDIAAAIASAVELAMCGLDHLAMNR